MGIFSFVKAGKKIFGKQKTTGETINPFKANPQTKTSKHKIELAKIPGQVKRKFLPIERDIQKTSVAFKQINQKLKGEKVTKSGVSKAKDMKAKGGRVGLKFGSKKSNVQKIKETFGPKKKLSPKQMKIAKLAGNPKKIDGPDFAKLRSKKA